MRTTCEVCSVSLSGGRDTFGGVGETLCATCYLSFADARRNADAHYRELVAQGYSKLEALMTLIDTPYGPMEIGTPAAIAAAFAEPRRAS